MLVSDIGRKVKRIFGEGGDVFILDADIIDWVNDGCLQIVRETKCAPTTLFVVANTISAAGMALDPGVISVTRVKYGNEGSEPPSKILSYASQEDLETKGINLGEYGLPEFWYINNEANNLCLFPVPQLTDQTRVYYTTANTPTALTLISQTPAIPTRYHEDLVVFCKARAYERNQDGGSAERAMNEFNGRISERIFEEVEPQDTYSVIRDDPWEF